MELILISDSKLKIMLSESDMEQYSIGNDADCVEPGVRRAIRSLLEKAREQIGFNTEGDEIFVQLYTSKNGGCELFVTKTASGEDRELEEKTVESTKRLLRDVNTSLPARAQFSEEKKNRLLPRGKDTLTFSFDSLEYLMKVCKIILTDKMRDNNIKSSATTDGDGHYFLTLENVGMSAFSRLDKLTFLCEYGNREDSDSIASYISEYGKVICQGNAIETLGELA